jgi:hypothetical protein
MQFTKYYWGDEVEEDEMAEKFNEDEGGDKYLQNSNRKPEGKIPRGRRRLRCVDDV